MKQVELCSMECVPASTSPIYGVRWHSTYPSRYPSSSGEWYFEKGGRLFWTEHYGVAVIQCERANFIQCGDKGFDPEHCWEVKEIPKMQTP